MSFYSGLLESVLWPLHNAATGRRYCERRRRLEETQWWSLEKLRDFQWNELSRLLDIAFTSAPYYQEKYAAAGARREDIRSWEDFARLPRLTRAEVSANRERLCNRSFGGRLLPHATGGSSGTPTRFFITAESYDWRSAATQRVYSWTGCRLGERAVYLWGAPVGKLPRWKAAKLKAYQRLQRQWMFNTFRQSDELWSDVLQRIRLFRPQFIVGYVSSLEGFAAWLRQNDETIPPIRAVIAAAEPVFPAARERIQAGLGAPLFNTYGSREFMSIAGECDRHSGLHVNAENLLVETACPDRASEVLVTDLHNLGMPFLRYEIGDVAELDSRPCACGRGLPLLRGVEGRILDMLRTADGRMVPGEFFPHLLKDIREIREFQVRQESLERIVITAVLSASLSETSRQLLENEVGKVFGASTRVDLTRVDEIPKLASGKRRVTIGLS
jgi:phenylacetate-CoA ligase